MQNLSIGVLPAEVITDIRKQMQELKQEIECLKNTEPPQDYTTDQIKAWLEALKSNSDEAAVHLLIERIDIKTKTALKIQSTLNTVLGEIGCGGWT